VQNNVFSTDIYIRNELSKAFFVFNPSIHLQLIISMGVLKQIAEYLYLKKKDPNAPDTQWVKYMHGINRLSILLFLFAMIVLAIKLLTK